ncbi:MAG: SpoIIE family protein phosphatase [Microscillaceae bacterium]|nr:SpoIIE family protein phosphatase [Microscillaceae bacterium]
MRISLKHRLTLNFLAALSFIAFLSVVSYQLTRYSLKGKLNDARLLNISGQQGILSQRIVKNALLVPQIQQAVQGKALQAELLELIQLWEQFHKGLQEGDANLGLPPMESPRIRALFEELTPYFRKLREYARKFTEINIPTRDSLMQSEMNSWLDSLQYHEKFYLRISQDITHAYDKEVNERLDFILNTQSYLLALVLLVLLAEWFLIFRPTRQVTLRYVDELHHQQNKMTRLFQELQSSRDEVQQKNEALQASEEEIRQNVEELEAINENLFKNTEELRQKNEILKKATELLDLKNNQIRKQRDQLYEQSQQLEIKNRNITNSLRYAKRIQDALIPLPSEITEHFDDAFVYFQPRDIVSGDFYWFEDKKGRKVLMVGDCTGHGVPGALMTMIGNSLINEIVMNKGITNPSQILKDLDSQIIDMLQRRSADKPIHDGMDMAVLSIDTEARILEYAAAHNPLYAVQNGEMIQVKGSKFPVGSAQYKNEKSFRLHTLRASPGDSFYLFSDGFQDQYSEKAGRKYMSKRFRSFLLMISHLPMAQQKAALEQEFEEWRDGCPQTDDVLVIGIKM